MKEIGPVEDFARLWGMLAAIGFKEFFLAAAGTFLGAYVAYRLSARSEKQKLKTTEDTAITRAFQGANALMNSALNFKSQVVAPKVAELEQLTAQVEGNLASEAPQRVMHLEIRELLQAHPPLGLQSIEISKLVTSVLSIAGRPIQLADELRQRCALLDEIIKNMNQMIIEFQGMQDEEARLFALLGLMRGDDVRSVDQRFRHTIDNLAKVTDDLLFFSHTMAKDLESHQTTWRKKVGLHKRSRLKLDDLGNEKNLLPNENSYASWLEFPVISLD